MNAKERCNLIVHSAFILLGTQEAIKQYVKEQTYKHNFIFPTTVSVSTLSLLSSSLSISQPTGAPDHFIMIAFPQLLGSYTFTEGPSPLPLVLMTDSQGMRVQME